MTGNESDFFSGKPTISNSVLPSLRTGTSRRKGKRESDTERQREAVNTEREEVIMKDRGKGGKRESDLERQKVNRGKDGETEREEVILKDRGKGGKRERRERNKVTYRDRGKREKGREREKVIQRDRGIDGKTERDEVILRQSEKESGRERK